MVLKNSYTQRRIDKTILGNHILLCWVTCQEKTICGAGGYLITLRDILKAVKASCEVVPKTVTELVKLYGEVEPTLKAADEVEVFSDQQSIYSRMDCLDEWGNTAKSNSPEQFRAFTLSNLICHFVKALPKEVDYID